MVESYRKRPVVIKAVRWTGRNLNEIIAFLHDACQYSFLMCEPPDLIIKNSGDDEYHVSIGDYIIQEVNGEFYPCKPEIFEKTYERVN